MPARSPMRWLAPAASLALLAGCVAEPEPFPPYGGYSPLASPYGAASPPGYNPYAPGLDAYRRDPAVTAPVQQAPLDTPYAPPPPYAPLPDALGSAVPPPAVLGPPGTDQSPAAAAATPPPDPAPPPPDDSQRYEALKQSLEQQQAPAVPPGPPPSVRTRPGFRDHYGGLNSAGDVAPQAPGPAP